ncbi:hypothetical protein M501DRAFT_986013 [Patellaria atrata CBS 101060]|uniref:Uncharacterized protein n=1 Tax=Patellaria atrata CBS 101060 TaxID=1346257 RepID=A0A9P4VPZ1_9PEZI|nr:hypothetical protein M501DRAFT_986013 [Patellaria atrata CBS 101060]
MFVLSIWVILGGIFSPSQQYGFPVERLTEETHILLFCKPSSGFLPRSRLEGQNISGQTHNILLQQLPVLLLSPQNFNRKDGRLKYECARAARSLPAILIVEQAGVSLVDPNGTRSSRVLENMDLVIFDQRRFLPTAVVIMLPELDVNCGGERKDEKKID